MNYTIILVDEPIKHDKRVQRAILLYKKPIIVDYTQGIYNIPHPIFLLLNNSYILLRSIVVAPFFWFRFYKKYQYYPSGFLSGMISTLRTQYRIKKTTTKLKSKYKNTNIDTIHANDLACGQIGMNLAKEFGCKLIYDAHELEFHRNRKNSFIRVVYDAIIEKRVCDYCTKLIVVNKPAVDIYREHYNVSKNKIDIVSNNHFNSHMNYALDNYSDNIAESAIMYIGGAINNRKLEDLHAESLRLEMVVHGYFLSKLPTFVHHNNWKLGSTDYLPEVLNLLKEKHLLMWCCTEDICLSYKLALPNKFFQAIAVGMPIIAYKDTYLAEIVEKYNIGYIYNDNNFDEIVNSLKDNDIYYNLLQSVALFQKKLFIDKLEL